VNRIFQRVKIGIIVDVDGVLGTGFLEKASCGRLEATGCRLLANREIFLESAGLGFRLVEIATETPKTHQSSQRDGVIH